MQKIFSLYLILTAAVFGYAAGTGITGSHILAIPVAILFAGLSAFGLYKYRFIQLDESACSKSLKILSLLAAGAALIQLAGLTVFMIDPAKISFSTIPSSDWEMRHSCLSAYYVAVESAGRVPDIYSNSLYSMPGDNPNELRKPRMLGPFRIDVYEYPPPFLLLPKLVSFISHDFLRVRMIWFALNGLIVMFSMLLIAKSLGPVMGSRAILYSPLVWCAMTYFGTMQKGNVQMVIIAMSMAAMFLFSKRRFFSGAGLLAYSIASKLYPAMLIVYLLLMKRWRSVVLTAILGLVFVLLTIPIAGIQSYIAFLHHLPNLLSGEAFPAFRNPRAVAINYSIPGIIYKLKLFGMAGDFAAMKLVGWIYTVIVLFAIFLIAKRALKTGKDTPIAWLSILILATLRSPFLPQDYAGFPPLWMLTLIAATYAPTSKVLIVTLLMWIGFNLKIPIDYGLDPRTMAVISLIPQLLSIGIGFFALKRFDQIETVAVQEPTPLSGMEPASD
jgi:alpha-1,2-mannosyltransferase